MHRGHRGGQRAGSEEKSVRRNVNLSLIDYLNANNIHQIQMCTEDSAAGSITFIRGAVRAHRLESEAGASQCLSSRAGFDSWGDNGRRPFSDL